MANLRHNTKGGFVKAVIFVLVALIVLGYFGYNIADIINKPVVQGNLEWAWNLTKNVWNGFIEKPAIFVWNQVAGLMGWTVIDWEINTASSTPLTR